MIEINLLEQIEYLIDKIISSPLILFVLFLLILIGSLCFAYNKRNDKKTRYVIIGIIFFSLLILSLRYFNPFLELTDGFIEKIIMLIYFPNIVVYMLILALSNILFIISLNSNLCKKIISTINMVLINFIFIIFLSEIAKNNIDIYQEITINSQKELLIILQLTTEIFTIYIISIFFTYIISKLYNLRNKLTREIIDIDTLEKDFS